jgi:hypothetical protein
MGFGQEAKFVRWGRVEEGIPEAISFPVLAPWAASV